MQSKGMYTGHLAMLGTNLLWGVMSPMSKAVLQSGLVGPLSLTTLRMVGAAAAFWILSLFTRREHVTPHDLALLFFASLFGVTLNQGFFITGVSLTSPIDASVVTTTTPIITMILSALYLKEPITSKKVMGIFMGAVGALILILSADAAHTGENAGGMTGNILCLMAELCFATYCVVFKDLIGRYSPVTLMKWMFTYAAICCIPFSYNGLASINFTTLPTAVYADLAFIVFGATFLSYLLVPIGQHRLRPTLVTMYCYLQPIVASMLAVLWGMDRFTPTKGAAILLVFVGVYLVNRSKSRAQMEAEALEAARRTAPDAPAMPDVPESSGRS